MRVIFTQWQTPKSESKKTELPMRQLWLREIDSFQTPTQRFNWYARASPNRCEERSEIEKKLTEFPLRRRFPFFGFSVPLFFKHKQNQLNMHPNHFELLSHLDWHGAITFYNTCIKFHKTNFYWMGAFVASNTCALPCDILSIVLCHAFQEACRTRVEQ